jgi:hypothetical protein
MIFSSAGITLITRDISLFDAGLEIFSKLSIIEERDGNEGGLFFT